MSSRTVNIEKLRGRENYDTWKRAAQSYLTINGYWSCTKSNTTSASEDAVKEKHEKALAEIYLMIEPQIYPYIDGSDQVKDAWEALANAFADTGTCRKVFILQQWASLKLNDCASMEEYVNSMTNLWAKVKSVGFSINEDVAASLLLAGLPEQYQPMIFGIENSKDKLTMDYIKNLLLQGAIVNNEQKASALFTKGKKSFNQQKKVKCYNCGGPHFARKCHKKKRNFNKQNEHGEANMCNTDTVLFSAFCADESKKVWVIDSGATAHMSRNGDHMINTREPIKKNIVVANSQQISVQSVGDINQTVETNDGMNEILIKNVQYVPDLCANLLSVSQMVKNDNVVVFSKNGCTIYNKNKKVIATGTLENDLFKLNTVSSNSAFSATNENNLKLWHRRLGHIAVSNMNFMKNVVDINTNIELNCVTCAEGKITRQPFKHTGTRASDFLELVHSDVCGPISVQSLGGAKYFVTFIDDFSRKINIQVIKNKSMVFNCFMNFKTYAEKHTGKQIKVFRTDNGTEYCNLNFANFLKKHGIVHQTSCPYTPQQNGLSERYNRTIAERARCMLFDTGVSRSFWAEAVVSAVRVINSTRNSATGNIPDEVWFNKPIDFSLFKVFGCKAMVMIPAEKRKKFDKKAIECIFVGYSDVQKGYRFYNKNTKKITVSRDAVFFENEGNEKPSENDLKFFESTTTFSNPDRVGNSSSNSLNDTINTSANSSNDSMNDTAINGSDISSDDSINATAINTSTNSSDDSVNQTALDDLDDTTVSQIDDRVSDPDFHTRATVTSDQRPATRSLAQRLNPFANFQSSFAFCVVSEALSGPKKMIGK